MYNSKQPLPEYTEQGHLIDFARELQANPQRSIFDVLRETPSEEKVSFQRNNDLAISFALFWQKQSTQQKIQFIKDNPFDIKALDNTEASHIIPVLRKELIAFFNSDACHEPFKSALSALLHCQPKNNTRPKNSRDYHFIEAHYITNSQIVKALFMTHLLVFDRMPTNEADDKKRLLDNKNRILEMANSLPQANNYLLFRFGTLITVLSVATIITFLAIAITAPALVLSDIAIVTFSLSLTFSMIGLPFGIIMMCEGSRANTPDLLRNIDKRASDTTMTPTQEILNTLEATFKSQTSNVRIPQSTRFDDLVAMSRESLFSLETASQQQSSNGYDGRGPHSFAGFSGSQQLRYPFFQPTNQESGYQSAAQSSTVIGQDGVSAFVPPINFKN